MGVRQTEDTGARVFLASVPMGHQPINPHPATAYLKAFVQTALNDVLVFQKDLNSVAIDWLLSKTALSKFGFNEDIQTSIIRAKAAMQHVKTYHSFDTFHRHKQVLERAFDTISDLSQEQLRVRGNTFTYISRFSYRRRSGLLDAIALDKEGKDNRKVNLFYDFYMGEVLPFVRTVDPFLIGLSIYEQDQLIPTIVLSSLIREYNPKIYLVWGGNHITRIFDVLRVDDELNRQIFDVVDFIIPFEGERPLTKLVARLKETKRKSANPVLSDINKIIYKDENGHICYNVNYSKFAEELVDVDTSPVPDFEELFTGLDGKTRVHWSPSNIIQLYTVRGCPYNCAFCTIDCGSDNTAYKTALDKDAKYEISRLPRSRERGPKHVVDDIQTMMRQYKCTIYSFGNESMIPTYLRDFSTELLSRGIRITWDCFARIDAFIVENRVNQELIDLVAKAGCRFIQFGLETTDLSVQQDMRKGRYPSDLVKSVLSKCVAKGIMNHIFVFVGFPTERSLSREDYIYQNLGTLLFLVENKDLFITCKATPLLIPRDSQMVVDLPNKNLVELREEGDIGFDVHYKKPSNLDSLDNAIVSAYDFFIHNYHVTNRVTHDMIHAQRLYLTLEELKEVSRISVEEKEVINRLWKSSLPKGYLSILNELGELERKLQHSSGRRRLMIENRITELKDEVASVSDNSLLLQMNPHGFREFDDVISHIYALSKKYK